MSNQNTAIFSLLRSIPELCNVSSRIAEMSSNYKKQSGKLGGKRKLRHSTTQHIKLEKKCIHLASIGECSGNQVSALAAAIKNLVEMIANHSPDWNVTIFWVVAYVLALHNYDFTI